MREVEAGLLACLRLDAPGPDACWAQERASQRQRPSLRLNVRSGPALLCRGPLRWAPPGKPCPFPRVAETCSSSSSLWQQGDGQNRERACGLLLSTAPCRARCARPAGKPPAFPRGSLAWRTWPAELDMAGEAGSAGASGSLRAVFEPCTKGEAGSRRPAYWRSSRVPSPRRRTLPSTMKPASRGGPLSKSTCSQPLRAFQRPLNSFALALRTQVFGTKVRTTA